MAKKTRRIRQANAEHNKTRTFARTPTLPRWLGDAGAFIGLSLIILVFFWPVITEKAFFWEDFLKLMYPYRVYTAVELSEGRFPFWCPYLFGGLPFFAMIDTVVLYPLNWLFVLFVRDGMLSYLVIELHTIGHILLIGIGMYMLCRSLGISRSSAFIAGATYMLSGRVIHHLFNIAMISPIAWLPFNFLLLIRTFDRLSIRLAIATGTILGITIVAGHPQILMYIVYAMGFFYLMYLLSSLRSSNPTQYALRLTGLFAVVIAVGLGLTAVVLLPTYELVNFSERAEVSYEMATTYSFHPRQIITFLMPDFFGKTDPSGWNYWGPYVREYGRYWETYTYVGILPLLLAGLALFVRRGRLPLYFGLLAACSFLLSFGDELPFYRVLHEILPGFDRFRVPARMQFILGFAVAVLVGYGMDTIWHTRGHRQEQFRLRRYLQVIAGILMAGLLAFVLAGEPITQWLAGSPDLYQRAQDALASQSGRAVFLLLLSFGVVMACSRLRRWKNGFIGVMAAIIIIDLFQVGYDFNQGRTDPDNFFPDNEVVRFLQKQQEQEGGRVNIRTGSSMVMRRNACLLYGIHTLEGYTSPLKLTQTIPPAYGLELMNVKYRIHLNPENRALSLVRQDNPSSHAFVVRHYLTAYGRKAVAEAMRDSSFNYRTTVVLDDTLSMDIPGERAIAPEKPVVTHYEPNSMEVTVNMTKPGILVVSEVYYPAWRAYVDGQPQRIYRANDTIRAVPLSAGRHTVIFRYESTPVRVGAILSMVTLILVIGTGIVSWREHRMKR